MKRALTFVVLLAAALLGCAQLLRPGFPHKAHLIEMSCGAEGQPPCPTCVSCHSPIREGQLVRPDRNTCVPCHGAASDAMIAKVRFAPAARTPVRFEHTTHLSQAAVGGQCVKCHQGIADDGAYGNVFPTMAECISCHDDGLEADQCATCHQRADLRALVPQTFLRHDEVFFRNHGAAAGRHDDVCSQCHAENECTACHDPSQPLGPAEIQPEAVDQPLIHRADFVVRHAIEARSSRDCARCHAPSFCDSCHLMRGISGNLENSINPHPIGWVGPDTSSASFHGRAARRDIVSCAGCHEAGPATNCIRCHQAGGPGGNPHPSGWRSFRSTDSQMCRYCHVP